MAARRFTDVELERSLAGDLSPARAAALASEATPADKARLAELERDQAEYLRGIDVEAEVRRIELRAERYKPEARRPWWLRYLLPIGTLAAAAAALVLFLQSKKPAPRTDDGDDFQTKGDAVSRESPSEAPQLATDGRAGGESGTATTVTGGLVGTFDDQNTVSGHFTLTVCPSTN